jgi:cytochrome c553
MTIGIGLKRLFTNAGLLLALTCLLSSPAEAQMAQVKGDPAAGRVLAERSCVICHGPDGNGNKATNVFRLGDLPRIAGLPAPYFIKSLRQYKRGQRPHPDMESVAEQLSDQDMRNVAAWYGSQHVSDTPTYAVKPVD